MLENIKTRELATKSDLTQGSIWKHLLTIAFPVVIGHMFNSLYNWTDTYWGGKISTEALAAFSLTFPVFLLSIAIGQGFMSGGLVLISNALGKKDFDEARKYMVHTTFNAILVGILLMIFVLLLLKPFLILLGAEGTTLQEGVDYLRVLAFGMPFLITSFALNVGLACQANTKFMRNIFIMNAIINFGLNPLFLFGWKVGTVTLIPSMGIKGIALATVFVQALGTLLFWIKIQKDPIAHWKSDTTHKIIFPKFDIRVSKEIMTYGMPTFLQIALASFGISTINFFVARLGGDAAVAGYGVGLRIEQMALIPSVGIGLALTAIVGQNNGAGQYKRIRESYFKAIIASGILWLTLMLSVVLFSANISRVFTEDFKAVQVAYFYVGFSFISYMGYQIFGNSVGLLLGMKQSRAPIFMVLIRQMVLPLVYIPIFAYLLDWGTNGVFMSVTASIWTCGIVIVVIAMRHIRFQLIKK